MTRDFFEDAQEGMLKGRLRREDSARSTRKKIVMGKKVSKVCLSWRAMKTRGVVASRSDMMIESDRIGSESRLWTLFLSRMF